MNPANGLLSCIICAFNEAARISHVLDIVMRHPKVGEVIVVDDGSSDGTAALVAGYEGVRLISYAPNRGKSFALARGVAAAKFETLLLLDADLVGLTPQDIDALAAPVLAGAADASLSLRGNSLYRVIGIDFVSGERVLPRALLAKATSRMRRLPRWGAEVFINERIIEAGLRLAVVDWRGVSHTLKGDKVGSWRGALGELHMVRDIMRELSPAGLVRQNWALWQLAERPSLFDLKHRERRASLRA